MRTPSLALAVWLVASSAGLARADSTFFPLGPRATGFGGAFTAFADDATAFQWNPAGVASGPFLRAGFLAGGRHRDRNELLERLRSQSPGGGSELMTEQATGFSLGFTFMGVAVLRSTRTRSVLEDKQLVSSGLKTWDVAVSILQSLPVDGLTIGVNLHYLRAEAHGVTSDVQDMTPSEYNARDVAKRATSSEGTTSSEPDLDVGVLYRPSDWMSLGVMVRHVAQPGFATEDGNELVLERQARSGIGFHLPRGFRLAIDLDLSPQRAVAQQAGYRELAGGLEKSFAQGRFRIRAGARRELGGDDGARPAFSGSFTVNLGRVVLDLGATTSGGRKEQALWLGLTLGR